MPPRYSRVTVLATAAIVAAALLGAAVAAGTFAVLDDDTATTVATTVETTDPAAQTTSAPQSLNALYRRAVRGVVEITAVASSDAFSPGGGGQQAQGSGFVYDTEGHVVTNQHVVDGAASITVTFPNGARYPAQLIGVDASSDLALLQVEAPARVLHPLALADSDEVRVGDAVLAIGSPFGLEGTLTSGIVSALHRQIEAPNNFTIDDAIQTDAAINHGNSGGPLLDLRGRVVGVNAQIRSDSGGNEGVGFAIPSNTVRTVVSQLISAGKVDHAYLGVSIQTIPGDAAAALGVPRGVAVTQVVPGAPAASAGLQGPSGEMTVNGEVYPTGADVITHIDGKRVTNADALRAIVDAKEPGDEVTLTVVRDGDTLTLTVTLGSRPS
jgi:S1-C subfamily serine protease